jgi:hypothetical protein
MPGWIHSAAFYFFAHAGTTNRIRPEDMGLGGYYFGVRYEAPDSVRWIKTTDQPLNWRQNESLAQAVTVDVAFASATSFVDAPFGVGTVNWELIVCEDPYTSWTLESTVVGSGSEIIKLPSITIDGVAYVNSGTFTVNHWLKTSETYLSWPSSGYSNEVSTINTSYSTWTIYSHPAWLEHHVYRGSVEVTGVNPYLDGDELRLIPNSINSGADRSGSIQLAIAGTPKMQIDVMQEGAPPSYYFNDADDYRTLVFDGTSYATLTVDGTSHATHWRTTSGLGSTNIPVWIRLWDTTDGVGSTWKQLPINTKDGTWNNTTIHTASGFVKRGHAYSIDITATDPMA